MRVSVPREQRGWWLLAAVALVGAIATAVWFGISASSGVSWTDAGHQVVDDQHIRVRFDVVDTKRRPLTCSISALGEDHGVVGRSTQRFAASEFDSTRHTVTLRTTQRAVTGEVEECVVTGS